MIYFLFNRRSRFLDYGGGYGVFVRLMRDIGFDFYWQDKFTQNLFAKGFEADHKRYELVTSFETFEHFVEPNKEIQNMLDLSDNILFSTELYGKEIPSPDKWDYFGLDHGQHISFYNIDTLRHIAKHHSLNLWSNGHSFHMLTKQKIRPNLAMIAYCVSKVGFDQLIKKLMFSLTLSDCSKLKNSDKEPTKEIF